MAKSPQVVDVRVVGIDTGGTFTDTVVITEGRRAVVGKAPSTPPCFEKGVVDSLAVAADAAGETVRGLLGSTEVIAHGTTVGLNALLTGTGARVGLLVTEGFESTLPLAKANKLRGLPPGVETNALRWRKPDLLVSRQRILGVRERVDVRGEVVVPLDEEHARGLISALGVAGVDAVGVSLLWSTVEPRHERRLQQLAEELLPGVPVTLSSDLAPRLGEYERTSSVVVNAYIAPLVSKYLEQLAELLRREGFNGRLLAVTMSGGVVPYEAATRRPIHTLQSGPAAGLEGSRQLGAQLGHENIIATDVGGTSFDVGLVLNGELPLSREPMIERQALAVPIVDINSIGTGGGSIAWVDRSASTVRVGPASAGSEPGPACYGRGGELPTLTDASVVLGYIDRLGGRLELDQAAAAAAIDKHVAYPLGIDVTAAAAGIYEVAVAQMSDLVRQATVRSGHDPAQFWLYAYGGAAPQYAARYAAELGTLGTIIPHLAPEFSAWGAATSDSRTRLEWEVAPGPLSDALPWVARRFAELSGRAAKQLGDPSSLVHNQLRVQNRVALRYQRQLGTMEIEVPDGDIDAHTLDTLVDRFRDQYATMVGSVPAQLPVELVGLVVLASLPRYSPDGVPSSPATPSADAVRTRLAVFEGLSKECPVYDWDALVTGAKLSGPAFVESGQTTAVVFPGQHAFLDGGRRLHLEVPNAR